MMRNRWWYLCCYLCIPLSGLVVLLGARGNPRLRFHAWQSTWLGGLYAVVLLALSVLDAVGGAVFRWAGAFVAAAAPMVGLFVMMVWVVVIIQLLRGHEGHIPFVAPRAERRAMR